MVIITNILLTLGLIALGTFIYRYNKFSPWRATFQGRTLMSQKVAWFVMILHFLAESITEYPGHNVIEILIITAVVILFYVTLWGLVLTQESVNDGLVPRRRGEGYVLPAELENTQPKVWNKIAPRRK